MGLLSPTCLPHVLLTCPPFSVNLILILIRMRGTSYIIWRIHLPSLSFILNSYYHLLPEHFETHLFIGYIHMYVFLSKHMYMHMPVYVHKANSQHHMPSSITFMFWERVTLILELSNWVRPAGKHDPGLHLFLLFPPPPDWDYWHMLLHQTFVFTGVLDISLRSSELCGK